MRLRVLVGRLGLGQLAGLVVDVIMALARAIDAVGPMQAGVEPLRRVGRHHLVCQHEAQFVMESLRVFLGREIAAFPAPISPAAREAIEHLLGGDFRTGPLVLGKLGQRRLVGDRAPEPGRNVVLLDAFQARGDAGLAEVFLGQHVGGHLAPGLGNLDVIELEDDRAVRVANLARGETESQGGVGRLPRFRIAPLDPHQSNPIARRQRSPGRVERGSPAQKLLNASAIHFRIATRTRVQVSTSPRGIVRPAAGMCRVAGTQYLSGCISGCCEPAAGLGSALSKSSPVIRLPSRTCGRDGPCKLDIVSKR